MGLFSSKKIEERKPYVAVARTDEPLLTFEDELTKLLNKYSLESLSNTPDFILAYYLKDCLISYNSALQRRTEWYKQNVKDEERVTRPASL